MRPKKEKYIRFIEGLAIPLETTYSKRYPARISMFSPHTTIWNGPFKAVLSELFHLDNYVMTMVENKCTKKTKLYIRETEMRLVGMVRLPDINRIDFLDYTAFWLSYWLPEKWQAKVISPEDCGLSKIPDICLLEEYNRRNPISKKTAIRTAEIIDFQKYLESTYKMTAACNAESEKK